MSISQVEAALTNFAVHNAGSAMVLKGEWGTGKTYIWDKVIQDSRLSFFRKTYSYVSLFGLNSLPDLKRSIFENSVPIERAGGSKTQESGGVTAGLRKVSSLLKEAKIPYVGNVGGVVDSIQYSLVKETLICIDDFERRGNGLSVRDVLGLITNLVEAKHCSVILILNEGSLLKTDEFFTFSEKVFDYEITYAPTLDEAATVVFTKPDEYEGKIVANVKKLGINNIRLLRKVRYFAGLIKPYVDGKSDEIIDESTKLIPLAIYAKYSGAEKVVDIEDLEKYKGGLSLFPPDKKELTAEQRLAEEKRLIKTNFFREYGYIEADDLTIEIVKLVKNGYADSNSLAPLIDSITSVVELNKKRKKISDAWALFHNDLVIADADLLDAFEKAMMETGDVTSPYEIDGVLEIFTAAGLEARGRAIVDKYFEVLAVSRSITHRRDLYRLPQSPYVLEKLEQYFGDVNRVWSLDELVDDFHSKPLTVEVVELLSDFNVDDFYAYFKRLEAFKFVNYARSLLALGARSGLPESKNYYEIVFLNVFEALKKMHDESSLMALRMNKFMEYEEMYNYKINQIGRA